MYSIKSCLFVLLFLFLLIVSVHPEDDINQNFNHNRVISKRGITEWRFRRTKQLESDILSSFDLLLLLRPKDDNLSGALRKPLAYRVKLVPEIIRGEDEQQQFFD